MAAPVSGYPHFIKTSGPLQARRADLIKNILEVFTMTNNEIIINQAIAHGIYTKAEAQAMPAPVSPTQAIPGSRGIRRSC